MKFLLQFNFEKDKGSNFWMPLFIENEDFETVELIAKSFKKRLSNTVKNISFTIEDYKSDDNIANKLQSYKEDERSGEYYFLNKKDAESYEIKEFEDNNDVEFNDEFFLKEFSKEVLNYLDLKKNTVLVREIQDNIDKFDTYLIIKVKRIAGIIRMDPKKNPKADLEKIRGTFMAGGLLVSMVIVYMLINLKFYDVQASELGQLVVEEIEEEIIPITQQNTPPPPPPPPPAAPEVIEIVEDDVEVEEIEMIDTEADAETIVEEFEVVEEVVEEEIFTIVESMPEFPGGGQEALFKYLQKEMKYPQVAKENGIQGTVFVNFVVGKDGKIRDVKILRGVNKMLDDEAIRVVKAMPSWKPGKQRGKAVSVSYNLPIKFTLR